MRIRQAIIPSLLTLGFAGSILAGVAVPVATAVTSSTPVAAAPATNPLGSYFHM